MKELERLYRRGLRWYPSKWRRIHGEALLDILLEAAKSESRLRPTAAEYRNLAWMGLRQRAITASPFVLFGVALLALLAVVAALSAGLQSDLLFSLPTIPAPGADHFYTKPSLPIMKGSWVLFGGALIALASTCSGVILLRRNRRAATTTRGAS